MKVWSCAPALLEGAVTGQGATDAPWRSSDCMHFQAQIFHLVLIWQLLGGFLALLAESTVANTDKVLGAFLGFRTN